jgi:hypothetical protein
MRKMLDRKLREKDKGKMEKYIVQQKASLWYETTIEATSEEEAIELASEIIMKDKGIAVDGSFIWEDEFWTQEKGDN